ncbi:hypothetical protein GCM10009111_24260 [Colwellia asteriadis]|uniref:cysteine desulfurase n=1 Tax=Colwellia asteriadis TaxID=517723 RepID=A0ABN1L8L5_9GAMM
MSPFFPLRFRQQFPLLNQREHTTSASDIIYFDNAATTQKSQQVITAQQHYYLNNNANVHRASHQLSAKATFDFEQTRLAVQQFIKAKYLEEIIWTKGASESINLVAQSLGRNLLKPGDEIVLSASEHHANIVPWQILAEQTGAVIKVLPINEQGIINITNLESIITTKTKIVACAHISNVLGRINPIEKIIARARAVNAISLIDGAQAIAHLPVNVQALGCDFYVFSAHKMYGPTGVGVLYGRKALLESMSPYQGGGEMIKSVSFNKPTTFNDLPFKFEAGTPNISGIIAFKAAITLMKTAFTNDIHSYEQQLASYCYQALAQIPQVEFIVQGQPDIALIAFSIKDHHNHDIASALDSYNIALRSGHHCAMPLMELLTINGCLRVSLAPYNTLAEIDYFIRCLKEIVTTQTDAHTEINTEIKTKETELKENGLESIDNILKKFSKSKGWDSLHREIMLLGKKLPRLPSSQRNEQSLIAGCESLAWLTVEQDRQGHFHFFADSDAKVIRGLLMIVLAIFNNKTTAEIQQVNIDNIFDELGLLHHLSPSRGNGLLAIVAKIKQLTE